MEDNFNTPVMDTKIEVLNEYSKVKMSSISKNKRPAAKFCKEAAKYILANWDNIEGLKQCQDSIRKDAEEFDDIKSSTVVTLYNSRITELSEEIRKEEEKKAPKQEKKAPAKKEVKSEDKEKQTKIKSAKNERKVGDIHPKHDTWVWTEYTPGKFDWRINPQDKQKVGAKAKSDESKPTKKVKKEAKPKEVKHVTIEEFLEQSKGAFKSQLSKTQKESLKLIQKGWRIVDINGTYFFKSSDGQNKSCNMDSVNALMKRMKIDYIPTGLILK